MRNREGLGRRAFLKAAGVAGAVALVGSALPGRMAWAAALTKAQRDKLTPDEIIQLMKNGNERFRMGHKTTQDYLAQQKASARGQYPAAVLLSCIDSRAPAETIMDLGIGDVFNTRVAGNVANDDTLGSMEFACKLSGAKVVLVMGHTATSPACSPRSSRRWMPPRIRASAPRRTTASSTRWRERMSSSPWPRSEAVVQSSPSSRPSAPLRSPGRCTTWRRRWFISCPRRPGDRPRSARVGTASSVAAPVSSSTSFRV